MKENEDVSQAMLERKLTFYLHSLSFSSFLNYKGNEMEDEMENRMLWSELLFNLRADALSLGDWSEEELLTALFSMSVHARTLSLDKGAISDPHDGNDGSVLRDSADADEPLSIVWFDRTIKREITRLQDRSKELHHQIIIACIVFSFIKQAMIWWKLF